MEKNDCLILCAKYPLLKKYIIECFENDRVDELMDFLSGIDTGEVTEC